MLGKRLVTEILDLPDAADALIEIVRDEAGAPEVLLHADLLEASRSRGVAAVALSLSHETGVVAGVVCPLDETVARRVPAVGAAGAAVSGVGIDVISMTRVRDVLEYPRPVLERLLGVEEARAVHQLDRPEALLRLATLLAAKEAAFKSLSRPLRQLWSQYLPGSYADLSADFRDVEIVGLDTAELRGVPRGTLARAVAALQLEAGEIRLAAANHGTMHLAVAVRLDP
jgi:phosphopantetheine--protein transferase-like protein